MKDKTIWIVALMWMAMILFVLPRLSQNKQVTPPPAQQVYQKAEAAEKAADSDKKKLNEAIKQYSQLQKKQYGDSEYIPQARLRIALIYETKLHDQRKAVDAYTKLVHDYPPADSPIGKEAQKRLTAYQISQDKKASKGAGYKVIDTMVALTGRNPKYSYALALLVITLVFKLITTPLSHMQFKSMREMQKVAPLVKQIQEKHKGNQQEIGKRTMALYKEHGINPLSGCLPLLAQMPILMLLYYKVIMPYLYQFTKGEFLWIGTSLAKKWPAIIGANLSMPDMPLLVIYTISMIVSQKLSVVDPSQAEQQKIMAWTMPIVFAFIFKSFPSAFMLYWLAFNVIGTIQQYQIMRSPLPGGPAAGITNGGNGTEPKEPKRPPVSPGKKSKGRKRHFDAQPVLKPIPAAT